MVSADYVSDHIKNDCGICLNASKSAACLADAGFLSNFAEQFLFKLNSLPFAQTSPNPARMIVGQTSHVQFMVKLMWKPYYNIPSLSVLHTAFACPAHLPTCCRLQRVRLRLASPSPPTCWSPHSPISPPTLPPAHP